MLITNRYPVAPLERLRYYFQDSRLNQPDPQPLTLDQQEEGEATLTFTALVRAETQTMGSMGFRVTFPSEGNTLFDERERSVKRERVTNPADSNDFVDVDVLQTVELVDQSGKVWTMRFRNPVG